MTLRNIWRLCERGTPKVCIIGGVDRLSRKVLILRKDKFWLAKSKAKLRTDHHPSPNVFLREQPPCTRPPSSKEGRLRVL
jgi:hypothetical protein